MEILLAVLAVLCRCVLIGLGSGDWLARRVEISTPINSWTRGEPLLDHVMRTWFIYMPHHPQSRRAWLFSPPTTPLIVETFFTRSAVHHTHTLTLTHNLPAATSGTDGVPMADQSRRMGSWNLLHCEIHTLHH